MNPSFFRKKALDRLSSPEQLDSLIRLARPKDWIALSALACLVLGALAWSVFGSISLRISGQGILILQSGMRQVNASASGIVREVLVRAGDEIETGQLLAVIDSESVRKGSEIRSDLSGRVVELEFSVGSRILEGNPFLTVVKEGDPLEAVIFIPFVGNKAQTGMEAQVCPLTVEKEEYGFLRGKVRAVSEFPARTWAVYDLLKNQSLTEQFTRSGTPYVIHVRLEPDPNTFSGFRWSSSRGPNEKIKAGAQCTAEIVVSRERPLALLLPALRSIAGF